MKAVQVRTISIMMVALLVLAGIAAAQETKIEPGSERPMFTRLPATLHSPRNAIEAASTPLQTWNGSFTFNGTTYNYNMVGVPPFPASSATITTYLIPVKIVLSNGATYDPSHVLSNGNTVTQNTVASPIFASSVDRRAALIWAKPSTLTRISGPISGTAQEILPISWVVRR